MPRRRARAAVRRRHVRPRARRRGLGVSACGRSTIARGARRPGCSHRAAASSRSASPRRRPARTRGRRSTRTPCATSPSVRSPILGTVTFVDGARVGCARASAPGSRSTTCRARTRTVGPDHELIEELVVRRGSLTAELPAVDVGARPGRRARAATSAVAASPAAKSTSGFHPSALAASDGSLSSTCTSLASGRTRWSSATTVGVTPRSSARRLDHVSDRHRDAGAELDDGAAARDRCRPRGRRPRAVSVTNVKSRRGARLPSRSSVRPASSWPRIVGITARVDWRGPKVLNGRSTVTGSAEAARVGLAELVGGDLRGAVRRLGLAARGPRRSGRCRACRRPRSSTSARAGGRRARGTPRAR